MDSIILTLTEYKVDDLRGAWADLTLGSPTIIQVENSYLCVCHYSKEYDILDLDLTDIPDYILKNLIVCVCFPQTVKRLYGLNTLGEWDTETIATLCKDKNDNAVIVLSPKTETEK